jgi:protein-tyrosine kinase
MSRIDEALARARALTPGDASLPPVQTGGIDPVFPTEGSAPEPEESAAASGPQDFSIQLPPEAQPRVLDVAAAELDQLPFAEKMTVATSNPTSVEQYRRLAARLYLAQAEHGAKIVMVTSALPGEGKTLTATNLALTLSESYKLKVLLIDGDLRRPFIHEMFQVPNVSGLNDGLRTDSDRKIPLISYTDNLTLLTAGRPEPDPMSVLSSSRMRQVLDEARTRFDWVIVDTPPVALLTDAHLLASLVDSVILVVRAGRTPLPALNTAVTAVGRNRVLGVVLNHAEQGLPDGSYQYYDYHATTPARG